MKIGLLSDSHKNIRNLKDAVQYLKNIEKVDIFIHLGDDFSDANSINGFTVPVFKRGVPVIKVPGAYDKEYKDPKIVNRMIKEYEGWKMLLTHTPGKHENDLPDDVNPELVSKSLGIKIILHGHTHVPKIEEKGTTFYINPGHLKDDDKKGSQPSFAVLEVTKPEIQVRIIGLKEKKVIDKFSILSFTD